MILATVTSWPDAAVAIAGMIVVGCVVLGIFIAITGSKFPWEK